MEEQFCISVHDSFSPSDSEKLVYLQHALKDGSAEHVIEDLYHSGEHYGKTVKCLTSHYDWLCLIHQAHVKVILEAPSLKDGPWSDLHQLQDTVQQHRCAMDYELSGHFITSMLEFKLDPNTIFSGKK